MAVHPTVGGEAADFKYEMWPNDEHSMWTGTFGARDMAIHWREVKR